MKANWKANSVIEIGSLQLWELRVTVGLLSDAGAWSSQSSQSGVNSRCKAEEIKAMLETISITWNSTTTNWNSCYFLLCVLGGKAILQKLAPFVKAKYIYLAEDSGKFKEHQETGKGPCKLSCCFMLMEVSQTIGKKSVSYKNDYCLFSTPQVSQESQCYIVFYCCCCY